MSQLLKKSLSEVCDLIRGGNITSTTVFEACRERLKKVSILNAFITLSYPRKIEQVLGASENILHGVPFAVKDNFCTKNIYTTCGSRMLKDFIPSYTATVIEKLLNAGGTLMGKNNLDEFGMGDATFHSIFGPSINPWKYDFGKGASQDWYVPGGSSGGSAVAVASGSCFFAVGSDTGGSVRNPAAYCGIVGLKPTYGTLSRHGLIPLTNSLDVPGILAKCVDDAAFIYNLLRGHDVMDSTTVRTQLPPVDIVNAKNVQKLVVGIPKEYHGRHLSSEILEAWDWAAGVFSDAGARVVEVSLPHTQYSVACYHVLCCGDVASNMARYDGLEYGHRASGSYTEELFTRSRSEGFNAVVRHRITAGNYFLSGSNYEKFYEKALKVRRLVANDFHSVFGSTPSESKPNNTAVDVLLVPSTLTVAPRYSDYRRESTQNWLNEHDIYTKPASLSGVPAVSLPVRLSQDGLPVSLQLIAPRFCESTLLRTAKFLESQSGFPSLDLSFL